MAPDDRDRLLALEAWEAAVTAYAAEAAAVIGAGLAAANTGLPCQRSAEEALARLLELRTREEEAMRACVDCGVSARRA